MQEKVSLRLWLIAIGVFVAVLVISSFIESGGVTYGILDHQAAGSAAKVDEIQTQWREGGVRNIAIAAVIADLAWIWLYALGAFVAGRGFATKRTGFLRAIGVLVCASAIVFAAADYLETSLQFYQLLQDQGDDTMAQFAASAQPIKITAFLVTFTALLLAIAVDKIASRRAS